MAEQFIIHAPLPRQRLVSLLRVVKKRAERNEDLSKTGATAQREGPRVRAHETL